MMKQIRIFSIVLLIAVLALPLDAVACDAQKATLDARQKAVDALEDEVNAREKKDHWLSRLFRRIGNNPIDDYLDDIEDLDSYMDYKDAQEKFAEAEAALATAQADYDNCVELTNKVNNVQVTLPCGHVEGTPGNHKKVICPRRNGVACDYGFYYACTPHTHAYSSEELLDCGHLPSEPGSHSLQASCSTDANCISTNFYQCQHTAHEYPSGLVCPDPSKHNPECWVSCAEGHKRAYYWSCEWSSCPECDYVSRNPSPPASTPPPPPPPPPPPTSTPPPTTPPTTPPSPPTPPAPTLAYFACGIHSYDVSSPPSVYEKNSHLYYGSCPETNSNGDRCTVFGFYDCQPHTHTYPSSSKNNNNNSSNNNNNSSNNNNHSSNNNNNHSSTAPSAPSSPVSYHPCGVHETTVSGDHSLQASCSRDSRCNAQNFYYCQHSSHTYPAPPPPPRVVCPANSWTSCGGTVSHATTCGQGHTYYTCNPDAVSYHSGHVAGVVCPANQWTNCGGTSSHATTCGQGHTYYTCNPDAVSAHSGHKKVVCPANGWTNCKGTVSHATTCGRGHTYYTCNPDAVSAHSWH